MLPLIWIVAGAAAIGVLALFWKEIKAWIDRIYQKLPESIQENLKGLMAFVQKIEDTVKNIIVYYSYREDTQQWTETTVSRVVDPSTVPKHILKKSTQMKKVDITNDLQKELELALEN